MRTKSTAAFLTLLVLVPGLWAVAPQAVLHSLKGKVEVRTSADADWAPAAEGEILNISETLSTGFDSSVVVAMGKTTLQVKPLTRMTVDKLVQEGSVLKTSTFLRVGSVSASVKSAEGVKQDFQVQSPYSTASVRGTEFTFDGLRLKVTDGVVSFVPGRPQRDLQTSASTGGRTSSPPESDFAGAPDTPADPGKAVPVSAGNDAKIVVTFQGAPPQTVHSDDLSNLQQSSGLVQSLPSIPTTPPPPPARTTSSGGVFLTIQYGP